MKNILITGDLHLGLHRKEMRRLEDGLECLGWIYQTAGKNHCFAVVLAGDFHHDRFHINTLGYQAADELVKKASSNGIVTYCLLGNHDCYYEDKWTVNSLTAMKDAMVLVDKPCTLAMGSHTVDFIPYSTNPISLVDDFVVKSHLLIGHCAVENALLHNLYNVRSVEDDSKDIHPLPQVKLQKWKRAFLGHYHIAQKLGDDDHEFIGSPMNLSMSEAGQIPHVAVYNLETNQTEYIENTISPRYHVVTFESAKSIDPSRAYIKVLTTGQTISDRIGLRNKLKDARNIDFESQGEELEKKTSEIVSKITASANDREGLLLNFLNSVVIPEHLSSDKLVEVGKRLMRQE